MCDTKSIANSASDILNMACSMVNGSNADRRHRWQRHLNSSRSHGLDKHGSINNYAASAEDDAATYNDDLLNNSSKLADPMIANWKAHKRDGIERHLSANNNGAIHNDDSMDNNELTCCQVNETNDVLHHKGLFEKKYAQLGKLDGVKIQDCFSSSLEKTLKFFPNRIVLESGQQQFDDLLIKQMKKSMSALDIRQLNDGNGTKPAVNRLFLSDLELHRNNGRSLTDSSHQDLKTTQARLERYKMDERLKSWTENYKITAKIRENPFANHVDCLNLLSQTSIDNTDGYSCQSEEGTKATLTIDHDGSKKPVDLQLNRQDEHLQNYATHLSYLYKQNQNIMCNNNDFRNLLYNIICCLLIQDERVLSTPSVTKMIDVIRTHLESASKFYSAAIITSPSLANNKKNSSSMQSQLLDGDQAESYRQRVASNHQSVSSRTRRRSADSNMSGSNMSIKGEQ